eukprot:CAMPEP_0198235604 /NCGR_PEP_ID=MMETSP1446-20131203/1489_1 /TAXON_ID=1461542 ORGANISM="Unidentified sp, Strain CCMP2111" /NCGR_SAMPLE_ID=MMETSP1446 /ASSEMBLY_ACC=CAM_ASM_001112 /LENGTH=263 /DNA_ID=CAMNT_0043916875 /DNA_START=115 /DNA_END=906 /DNA_ORIENTATION=+
MAIPLEADENSPERKQQQAGSGDLPNLEGQGEKYYKVVHRTSVATYETATLASAASSFKPPGTVVLASAPVEGNSGWIKLSSNGGWMLLQHPVDGSFMEEMKPATFKVVHKAVLIRKHANTSAAVLQIKREGEVVQVEGHLEGWLRVKMGPGHSAWALTSHETYGKLLQYVDGEIPTFNGEDALEGTLEATPSSVYTGRATNALTEELRNQLGALRTQVADQENEESKRNDEVVRNYEVVRRGLMANAGQSSSSGFCVGGNPL